MKRFYRHLVLLQSGAVVFGVLQAFEMVSFAQVITDFLTEFLSLLMTMIFGGSLDELLGSGLA